MRAALVMTLVGAFLLSACDHCKRNEDAAAKNAALEEKVKELESMAAGPDKEPAASEKAEPPKATDDCATRLAACEQRLTKCEKDPFTGTKYLTGDDREKKKK